MIDNDLKPPSPFRFLKAPLFVIYVISLIGYAMKENPAIFKTESLLSLMAGNQKSPTPFLPTSRTQSLSLALPAKPPLVRVGHNYYKKEDFDFPTPFSQPLFDSDIFYFLSSPQTLQAVSLNGSPLWSFSLDPKVKDKLLPPTLGATSLYLVSESGKLFSLNKETGQLEWFTHLQKTVLAPLTLVPPHSLYFFTPAKEKRVSLYRVDLKSQKSHREKIKISSPPASPMVYSAMHEALYWGGENGILYCFSLKTHKSCWIFQTSSTIKSPPLVTKNLIIAANTEGEVYALSPKYGRERWKYELSAGSQHPLTLTPTGLLSAYVDNGYLHTIKLKTGEGKWRFNTHNTTQSPFVRSYALKNKSITKLELPWSTKGWTLWAPCFQNRICIFNSQSGQLIWRIRTRAPLISPLYHSPTTKSFYAISKQDNQTQLLLFKEYIPPKISETPPPSSSEE